MSDMLQELSSSPSVVRSFLKKNGEVIKAIAAEFRERGLSNIITVARGTSDSAATYFKYLSEIVAGVPVAKYLPSVTTVYGQMPAFRNNMLLAISQSGQSTDTMLALTAAKSQGALTVSMTNDPTSPLATKADFHIDLCAGEEKAVVATKSFIAQLIATYELVNALSDKTAKFNPHTVPALIEDFILSYTACIKNAAERAKNIQNVIVLSRGLLQGIANELSLKLIETSYLFSRAFSTSDFMHGPLAIVTEGTNVALLAPSGEMEEEFTELARRLSLLGANIVAFTDIKEITQIATSSVEMPKLSMMEAPFVYAIAIQMFTENLAHAKGQNPDQPRNLKKVTITK